MSDTAARRGRREAELDESVPEHLRELAQRLRDLRAECGGPPYRVLSGLAHCATSTLSEAASGRRAPTWETTRSYVIGCLRFAGRTAELDRVLPRWEALWERAVTAPAQLPVPVLTPAPAVAPEKAPRRSAPHALVAVILLLVTGFLLASDEPDGPAPMRGTFNIAVVAGDSPELARSLAGELRSWAGDPSAIEIRALPGRADADLERTAAEQNADVLLRPVVHPAGSRVVTTAEIFVSDGALGEAPEFAGRHDLTVSEPAAAPGRLTGTTRRYLEAVVTFLRGLSAFANADYPAAEGHFIKAGEEFDRIADATRAPDVHRVVVDLMAGNAAGRINPARAIPHFRRALDEQPGYGRARVGLAEAYRAQVRCERGADLGLLDEAESHYRLAAAGSPENPLLGMKANLGLGLSASCRGQAGGGTSAWAAADAAYAEVRMLYLDGNHSRNARWLAAEATAGAGLDALLGRGDVETAAERYERAIDLMAGITAPAPVHLEREAVFLRVLQGCYERLDRPDKALETDARLRETQRRLQELTPLR